TLAPPLPWLCASCLTYASTSSSRSRRARTSRAPSPKRRNNNSVGNPTSDPRRPKGYFPVMAPSRQVAKIRHRIFWVSGTEDAVQLERGSPTARSWRDLGGLAAWRHDRRSGSREDSGLTADAPDFAGGPCGVEEGEHHVRHLVGGAETAERGTRREAMRAQR